MRKPCKYPVPQGKPNTLLKPQGFFMELFWDNVWMYWGCFGIMEKKMDSIMAGYIFGVLLG